MMRKSDLTIFAYFLFAIASLISTPRLALSQTTVTQIPFSQLPPHIPADIPRETSLNLVTQNYTATTTDGRYQATRVFITLKSLDENFQIYHTYFTSRGWTITNTLNQPRLRAVAAAKGDLRLTVTVNTNSVTGQTTVDLSLLIIPVVPSSSPLKLEVTAPETLGLENNQYTQNPFPVTVKVSNTGATTLRNVTVTFTLSSGLSFRPPTTPTTEVIGNIISGQSKIINYHLSVAPQNSDTTLMYSIVASAATVASQTINKKIVVPEIIGPGGVVLFDSLRAQPPSNTLDSSQQYSYEDSRGKRHSYHVFATANAPRRSLSPARLKITVQPEPNSYGSRIDITVPSGWDKDPTESGGVVTFIIPFGLNVKEITGINADFHYIPDENFLKCVASTTFDLIKEEMIKRAIGEFLGPVGDLVPSIVKCLEPAYKEAFQVRPPSKQCDVLYPIPSASLCLFLGGKKILYGENTLNTHQTRIKEWKPDRDLNVSTVTVIRFHLEEPPQQVLKLISQKGITLHVLTSFGDMFLDNFK